MISILVAGNSEYGLAAALGERYPNAVFASRSTGYDLTTKEGQGRFAAESINYDVVMSVSCLHSFEQVKLVEKVVKMWRQVAHDGRLIVLGSAADSFTKPTDWVYPSEKKALKAYCRDVSTILTSTLPDAFNLTYLSVGMLDTPQSNKKYDHPKIRCSEVVDVIEWIIHSPHHLNLSEISLERVHDAH